MKVLNEYPTNQYREGHHYIEVYEKCDFFCPSCGVKNVWQNMGSGDYYIGSDYICINCNKIHYLDNSDNSAIGPNDLLKIKQIKSGITEAPSTPRGG